MTTLEVKFVRSYFALVGVCATLPLRAAEGYLPLMEEGFGNPIVPIWLAWLQGMRPANPPRRRVLQF